MLAKFYVESCTLFTGRPEFNMLSGIDILKSDTTLQINDKYLKKFSKKELINFRNIYLHIRYRNDMPKPEEISEFKRLYNDILK